MRTEVELVIISEEQNIYAQLIDEKFILVNGSLELVSMTGEKVDIPVDMPAEYIEQVKQLNGTKTFKQIVSEKQLESEGEKIVFTPEEYRKHIAEAVAQAVNPAVRMAVEEVKKEFQKQIPVVAKESDSSSSDIRKILEEVFKLAKNNNTVSADRMIMTEVPTEDLLEEPVLFYARQQTYTIWSDYRKGFDIRTPYRRPIHFTNVMRSKSQTAGGRKNADVIAISAVQIISKKELEFLETHSDYGIKFFKNIAGTVEKDNEEYRFLEEASREVGTNELELIQKANAYKVPVDMTNLSALRRKVIEAVAKEKLRLHRSGANFKNTVSKEYLEIGTTS